MERYHPWCLEVIHTENCTLYLVDFSPIHLLTDLGIIVGTWSRIGKLSVLHSASCFSISLQRECQKWMTESYLWALTSVGHRSLMCRLCWGSWNLAWSWPTWLGYEPQVLLVLLSRAPVWKVQGWPQWVQTNNNNKKSLLAVWNMEKDFFSHSLSGSVNQPQNFSAGLECHSSEKRMTSGIECTHTYTHTLSHTHTLTLTHTFTHIHSHTHTHMQGRKERGVVTLNLVCWGWEIPSFTVVLF